MHATMIIPKTYTNDEIVKIIEWLVPDKKYVEKGSAIVRIETSKTLVDIESEHSGYMLIHAKQGETVSIGSKLASFFKELSFLNNGQPSYEQESSDSLFLPETNISTRFSKSARQYMMRNHLDPLQFSEHSLVTHAIVENNLKNKKESEQYSSNLSIHFPDFKTEEITSTKASEIRLLSEAQAGNLTSSLTVQFDSAPIRQNLKIYPWLNKQILPYILVALSKLLTSNPKFTSYYEKDQIVYYNRVNLGLAIDLGKGLRVVVIKDADKLNLSEMHHSIIELVSRYYENSLLVEELSHSTITITDLSSDDILNFQPLINKNQAVIVGIGGDSSIAGHPIQLTLVFDHRILTGREVAIFLKTFKYQITKELQI